MNDKLRKAKLTKFEDGSGDYTINCWFHQWGTTPIHTDNGGTITQTCGIIELEDGTVQKVQPNRIRFVNQF